MSLWDGADVCEAELLNQWKQGLNAKQWWFKILHWGWEDFLRTPQRWESTAMVTEELGWEIHTTTYWQLLIDAIYIPASANNTCMPELHKVCQDKDQASSLQLLDSYLIKMYSPACSAHDVWSSHAPLFSTNLKQKSCLLKSFSVLSVNPFTARLQGFLLSHKRLVTWHHQAYKPRPSILTVLETGRALQGWYGTRKESLGKSCS